jgi:diguanylate cyclase (GGDEF)-like protein
MRVALPRRWSARLSAVDRWLLLVRPVAVVVVLLGVAASTWIAQGWQATITRQRDERLDRTAVSRTATVGAMLAHYEDALLAERSLWLASTFVSREDFRNFASTLDLQDRYPGLQRIGWREQVPGQARARFLARARRDRAPHFTIRPPGQRPIYYVTLYSELASKVGSTIGVDARTDPNIRAALEQARDHGRTILSGPTTLSLDLSLAKGSDPWRSSCSCPCTATTRRRRRSPSAGRRCWDGQRASSAPATSSRPRCGQPSRSPARSCTTRRSRRAARSPPTRPASSPPVPTSGPARSTSAGAGSCCATHPCLATRSCGNASSRRSWCWWPGSPSPSSWVLGAMLWLLAQVSTLYQRVGRLAVTDGLTGAANRRVWDQELPRALARAARSGVPLCVALIDLDRFKAFNDRHGHQAGDRLLKAAAAAWQERLRKTDLLVRYGGEEFAVLLPDCRLEDAMIVADRLLTAQPEGTCSIGLAAWDGAETELALVARADQALYAAKEGGRNRWCASPQPGSDQVEPVAVPEPSESR